MSDKLQINEDARKQIIKDTAIILANLLDKDMNGIGCIATIRAFARGIEECNLEDCEPVYPPAKPTMQVRAAGVVHDTGGWCVYGASRENRDGSHTQLSDDELLGDILDGSERVSQISFIEIDLPVPQMETVRAAKVEEVAS